MVKFSLVYLCIFFFAITYAQDRIKNIPLSNQLKADISLQGIGISYDLRANENILIEFAVGVGGGYAIAEQSFAYDLAISEPAFFFIALLSFFTIG